MVTGDSLTPETLLGLLNLHDAFLNAELVATRMRRETDLGNAGTLGNAMAATALPRFRFERLWIALLAVLVESWRSPTMAPVHEYVESVADTSELERLLSAYQETGMLERIKCCRHYMFHRDRPVLGRRPSCAHRSAAGVRGITQRVL
jgi:hypothetical protein